MFDSVHYAMKKSKKSSEEPRDRLSELPDSIIYEIFWLLPMRVVVRTTILSKRWNNLWKTTPYLNFYGHAPKFVNRALIWWKGCRILKFKFGRAFFRKQSGFSDVDLWVHFAKENGVEELYLENLEICDDEIDDYHDRLYSVPHNLYSCSSLKVLSLKDCYFKIDGNVQWNKLRSLTMEGYFLDEYSIDRIVSGSPLLEVCSLNIWNDDEDLSIRSTSLKRLSIKKYLRVWTDGPYTEAELKIWSPNLETLDIIGLPYGKFSLTNVSSVTHLTLDFGYEGLGDSIDDDFMGEILGQIFPTIPAHVEKLTLSGWCIKVLGAMEDKHLLSPLSSNLKFFTINKNSAGEYEHIVDLLQIFPKLKTLVLQPEKKHDKFNELSLSHFSHHAHQATSVLQVERNLPESFLLQLRTVEITLTKVDDLIFPFVEILLKHASNLQKLVFRVEKIKPLSMPLFLALQKLTRMPRSSPAAELIFA